MVYLGYRTKLKVLAIMLWGLQGGCSGSRIFTSMPKPMAFLSTFSVIRKTYKASITNGLKKIINFISSIHKFLGEILEINRFAEVLDVL